MKKLSYTSLILGLALIFSFAQAFAVSGNETNQQTTARNGRVSGAERMQNESLEALPQSASELATTPAASEMKAPVAAKADKQARKQMRRQASKLMWKKMFSPGKTKEVDFVLIVILTILLPPLGVYLYDGTASTNFWIDLILWLIAVYFGGLIFGLLVIFDVVDLG
ncbi:MAG: YqaE/Pmp3 family membrane protein [Bacteroidia bacterium]|nr:YqaE/Pmp3 family membrane protein [Bacteroidia bacterium]